MIGLVVTDNQTKDIHAVYYGPYATRLAARNDLERAVLDAQRLPRKVVHKAIFNIETPA